MLYELIRSIVQKVLQDKILLGLVIVAVLGLFVGGMTIGDDKGDTAKKDAAAVAGNKPAEGPGRAAGPPGTAPLTPQLASDFVNWWLGSAMDFNASTATQNHAQALAWMTPDAQKTYEQTLWTPQVAQAVASGQLVAAFQPTGIKPQAVNPDGTVVVGVSGTMIVQSAGQPVTQQFFASFLVKQDQDGLRVSGIDSRTAVIPGSSVY